MPGRNGVIGRRFHVNYGPLLGRVVRPQAKYILGAHFQIQFEYV